MSYAEAKHPHEPEIPLILDGDGRCKICVYIHQLKTELIERCARIADEHETHPEDDIICNGYQCASMIAHEIRGLAPLSADQLRRET